MVPAARFVEAALQLMPRAVEEQGCDILGRVGGQLFQLLDHLGRNEAARPAVEADRQRVSAGIAAKQPLKQADREIVDRFPAKILQLAQGRGLARTQHAGDEQQALARRNLGRGHGRAFAPVAGKKKGRFGRGMSGRWQAVTGEGRLGPERQHRRIRPKCQRRHGASGDRRLAGRLDESRCRLVQCYQQAYRRLG